MTTRQREVVRIRGRMLRAAALVLAAWSMPAHAYIDPGSGGFVLQMLLAALAAGGVWVGAKWRMLVHAVKTLFSRRKPGSDDAD